ncbi:MAG: ferrous iron transport protein A [Tissierellia bacterium]|nr:ferrous iron transport protein A [Tissierellia bacterium]
MKTLDQVSIGDIVKVVKIHGTSLIKRRIMDMGITKNTTIEIIKFAPLGDPIEMKVRGYGLSIRKNDAKNIEIA